MSARNNMFMGNNNNYKTTESTLTQRSNNIKEK